jgi:hypothetical protein
MILPDVLRAKMIRTANVASGFCWTSLLPMPIGTVNWMLIRGISQLGLRDS